MNFIQHTHDLMRLLMRPLKTKNEIYHFKVTEAITDKRLIITKYFRVSILLNQLQKLKSDKPSVIMLSVDSAIGSFT